MTEIQIPTSAYGRPLIQAARELGKHLATLHRWRESGIIDPSGVRRRLRMTRVGGRWFLKDEDLAEFFAALSAGDSSPPAAENTAARSRTHERAARELDALNI